MLSRAIARRDVGPPSLSGLTATRLVIRLPARSTITTCVLSGEGTIHRNTPDEGGGLGGAGASGTDSCECRLADKDKARFNRPEVPLCDVAVPALVQSFHRTACLKTEIELCGRESVPPL